MSPRTTAGLQPAPGFYRLSVDQYHRMLDAGILEEGERVELLEGYLVPKMPQKPPHASALQRTKRRIEALLPLGWDCRIQLPLTLSDSEPEPDIAMVLGPEGAFDHQHPGPAEVGLIVEVSDSTRVEDRDRKVRVYSRAGIAEYWIVNLVDRQVEVHTQPSGPVAVPSFGQRQLHGPGESVPLSLGGAALGHLLVAELMP